MRRVFSMTQRTAMLLNKIGMYSERHDIIRETCGYTMRGLTELSDTELLQVQDWCKRYASSHGIILEKKDNNTAAALRMDAGYRTNASRDNLDVMRKKIISYAHQMMWKTPEGKADIKRINNWCMQYGQFHKALNEHDETELPKLLTQFETVFINEIRKMR